MITWLDGPMGSELQRRGADTSGRAWSATALTKAPELVRAIHRDYAAAGATVHTANTFRTRPADVGARWRELTQTAVNLARESVPAQHRVFGSMAPIEDCYRPDLSPSDPEPAHRAFAQALANCGVDGLLVETFPHPGEAMAAVRAAVQTGLPTWLALTAGYRGDLLSPRELADAARQGAEAGADAVLVNCTPAEQSLAYVQALSALSIPIGVYANAGHPDHGVGWSPSDHGADRYAELAMQWVDHGATLLGCCCGTGPEHIAAMQARYRAAALGADNK